MRQVVICLQLRRNAGDAMLPVFDAITDRQPRALDRAAERRMQIAVDQAEQCGLSRTVRAEHCPMLARSQRPVEIANDGAVVAVDSGVRDANDPARSGDASDFGALSALRTRSTSCSVSRSLPSPP